MVLENFGKSDMEIATLVCKTLCNYACENTNSIQCFGEQECDLLIETLTELCNRSILKQLSELQKKSWTSEFCPVANHLLQNIQDHYSDLVPLSYDNSRN